MSRRYWLPAIAIGLAAFLALPALANTETIGDHHQEAERSEGDQEAPAEDSLALVPDQPAGGDPAARPDDQQRSEDGREEDIQRRIAEAARDQADAVQRQAKLTLVQNWLLVGTVAFTAAAAGAAFYMAKISKRIGRAQVRAYLAIEKASYRVRTSEVLCDIEIKNFGQSPALRVFAVASLERRVEDQEKPNSVIKDKLLTSHPFRGSWGGVSAAKSQSTTLTWTNLSASRANRHGHPNTDMRDFIKPIETGKVDVRVRGALIWMDVFEDFHESEFILTDMERRERRVVQVGFKDLFEGEFDVVNTVAPKKNKKK